MTKKPEYYTAIREDIIDLVPDGACRILEVGCGAGLTGRAIKEKKGASVEITGIEIIDDVAQAARANLDKVIIGNVETLELPFNKGYFDCIIYGDVLEHLVDPWTVLAKHKEHLKKGGHVIISLPNIAHYRTIKMLWKKKWDYKDRGIMDKTHLRFFALDNIKEMLKDADLEIVSIKKKIAGSKSKKLINKLLRGAISDYLAEQYIVVAKK
jgi:2-polyprenyl-3-methyl-5-hydroxy-6-metoxy-1,4-benzoquinol methylase